MPVYEYICNGCSDIFSVLKLRSSDEKTVVCPSCGSGDVTKKLSAFSCSVSPGSSGGGSFMGST